MNKLVLVSALSLIVTACGGDNKAQDAAKGAVKDVVNNATETVKENATGAVEGVAKKAVEAVGASAETAEKVADMAKTAVANVAGGDMDLAAHIQSAKKTTKAFGGALKAELKKAKKAGGLLQAIDVCNTEAMPITERVAKEQGATLSRVSLKNRNADNVPNDWQKTVLEDFDARFAKGESVKKMAFAKIVENDGKKQFRFMKALPTGGKCLDCHGSEIDADVSAKLAELYPNDKATGYQKGQVRGAIVIVKDLK